MNLIVTLTVFLFIVSTNLARSEGVDDKGAYTLAQVSFLVGRWRGTGEGKWGTSSAEREYISLYDGTYIRGTGSSVYPKQEKNPSGDVHEYVDFFSMDTHRETLVLREFDSESFVTTYYLDKNLSVPNQKLVFVAEYLENVPSGWGARMILEFSSHSELIEHFELDTNKGQFQRYLTNTLHRVQPGQ